MTAGYSNDTHGHRRRKEQQSENVSKESQKLGQKHSQGSARKVFLLQVWQALARITTAAAATTTTTAAVATTTTAAAATTTAAAASSVSNLNYFDWLRKNSDARQQQQQQQQQRDVTRVRQIALSTFFSLVAWKSNIWKIYGWVELLLSS